MTLRRRTLVLCVALCFATAMEVRLNERSSVATDFGTAILETRFGFHTLLPKADEEPFGISVRRFLFSSDLSRVELYDADKAAFL